MIPALIRAMHSPLFPAPSLPPRLTSRCPSMTHLAETAAKREKKTGKGRGQFYTRDCNTFETIHNLSSDRAAVGNERGVTAAAAAALARGAGRQGGGEVVLRNAQSPSRRRPRGQSWVRGGRCDDGVKVTEGMVLFWRAPSCFAQWTPAEFEIDNVRWDGYGVQGEGLFAVVSKRVFHAHVAIRPNDSLTNAGMLSSCSCAAHRFFRLCAAY